MKKASLIIINYNTSELTLQAINSFYKFHNTEDYQVIVVDNGSEITDYLALEKEIQNLDFDILLERSRINLGFSGGNMLGVQKAFTPYYVFVNSDVIFINNAVEQLVNYLEKHDNCSIVGAHGKDEFGKFHKAFDYKISFFSELFSHQVLHRLFPKKYYDRNKKFDRPTEVDAVPGSLFAVNAKDFDFLGGFDTHLFLYYEEKELAFRIQKLNKKIVSFPVEYIHLEGKSTKPSIDVRLELKRSKFYTLKKHLPFISYLIFYIITLITYSIKGWFSKKNRCFLLELYQGMGMQNSLRNKQKIHEK